MTIHLALVQKIFTLGEALLTWLETRSPRFWRGVALGILSALSLFVLFRASVVIDGSRYFWLDDDQMISMRYARNLAQGYGLVWNPGERVEGYTNFLWTLVMAGVHLFPLGDANMALAIKVINWALACAILFLSERLLRHFLPAPGLALPALWLTLALCKDIVYWSANGFETTLLTALFLFCINRILQESASGPVRLSTYLAMGLLPLVRSDAYYAWASAAILCLGLSKHVWRELRMLSIATIPPSAHLFFRYASYGEWLPNTYFLKVTGKSQLIALGLSYVSNFLSAFAIPLVVILMCVWLGRDRRMVLMLGGLLISIAYIILAGGDIFPNHRFLAHLVPVIFVLALVAAHHLTMQAQVARVAILAVLTLAILLQDGIYNLNGLNRLTSVNGLPESNLVTGIMLQRFSAPDATVAVFAAGNVPYFSHRYSIDLLGKSDKHIARLTTQTKAIAGHDKFDADYSLGLQPDLIVMLLNHDQVIRVEPALASYKLFHFDENISQFSLGYLGNATFQREYQPNPIPVPYLLERTSVYVRKSSSEMSRLDQWRAPNVSR